MSFTVIHLHLQKINTKQKKEGLCLYIKVASIIFTSAFGQTLGLLSKGYRGLSPGVEPRVCEADRLPPCSAEVKKASDLRPTLPYDVTVSCFKVQEIFYATKLFVVL
jgi:hypothetical protein